MDNLKKKGFYLVNRCYFCKEEEESVDYMMLHCLYVRKLWDKFITLLCFEWVFPNNIQDFFIAWKTTHNILVINIWNIFLPHFWWEVWKERNDRVFRGKESNSNQIFYNIRRVVTENVKMSGKDQEPNGDQETLVIKNWKVDDPHHLNMENNLRNNARWGCPPKGWYKNQF